MRDRSPCLSDCTFRLIQDPVWSIFVKVCHNDSHLRGSRDSGQDEEADKQATEGEELHGVEHHLVVPRLGP